MLITGTNISLRFRSLGLEVFRLNCVTAALEVYSLRLYQAFFRSSLQLGSIIGSNNGFKTNTIFKTSKYRDLHREDTFKICKFAFPNGRFNHAGKSPFLACDIGTLPLISSGALTCMSNLIRFTMNNTNLSKNVLFCCGKGCHAKSPS